MEFPEINNLKEISNKLLELNQKETALMYLQITRGSFPTREHDTPYTKTPIVTLIPYNLRAYNPRWKDEGISCMLAEDIRWTRRDIKSLNLLGNIMLKQKANDCGFDDVVFYEKHTRSVTEASSSNLMIVRDGKLWTHPANNYILNGITKNRVIELAKNAGIETIEKEFTIDDMMSAQGVFLTNSGYRVRFVTSIDGKKIGNGKPCPVSEKMFDLMESWILQCIHLNKEKKVA
jgi:D-alanine transaminase